MIVQDKGGGDTIHVGENTVEFRACKLYLFIDGSLFFCFQNALEADDEKLCQNSERNDQKEKEGNQEFRVDGSGYPLSDPVKKAFHCLFPPPGTGAVKNLPVYAETKIA